MSIETFLGLSLLEMQYGIHRYGSFLEELFRIAHYQAHYQYISIPVYKFCGGHDNPFWATFISCTISDIAVHHALSRCLYEILIGIGLPLPLRSNIYQSLRMVLGYSIFVSLPLSSYKSNML